MRVWLLDIDDPERPTTGALLRGWADAGHEVALLDADRLDHLPAELDPDTDLVQYRLHSTDHFAPERHRELIGFLARCRRLSPALPVICACRDKRIGQALLEAAGLPVPPWVELDRDLGEERIREVLGKPPWVAKPARGGQGRDVRLCRGLDGAHTEEPMLLQKAVEPHRSFRVLASSRRAVAVYERTTGEGFARTISSGGERVEVRDQEMRERLIRLGTAMCGALGGDVLGLDVLEGEDGRFWALEANANPGFDSGDELLLERYVYELASIHNP